MEQVKWFMDIKFLLHQKQVPIYLRPAVDKEVFAKIRFFSSTKSKSGFPFWVTFWVHELSEMVYVLISQKSKTSAYLKLMTNSCGLFVPIKWGKILISLGARSHFLNIASTKYN